VEIVIIDSRVLGFGGGGGCCCCCCPREGWGWPVGLILAALAKSPDPASPNLRASLVGHLPIPAALAKSPDPASPNLRASRVGHLPIPAALAKSPDPANPSLRATWVGHLSILAALAKSPDPASPSLRAKWEGYLPVLAALAMGRGFTGVVPEPLCYIPRHEHIGWKTHHFGLVRGHCRLQVGGTLPRLGQGGCHGTGGDD